MRKHLVFLFFFFCLANIFSQARIESEYKIGVPNEDADQVWQFLEKTFSNNTANLLPDSTITNTSVEIFYDTYFDDPEKTLLSYQAGARYRERYLGDSLMKTILQLKIPTQDASGIARTEHKFTPKDEFDINDRSGMHPFLKRVKSKDKSDIDLVLGQFGTESQKLDLSIKVKQIRKRIYVSDNFGSLMTFTLDKVSSFYFPYSSFVELELELNEIRYTDADFEEKKRLEDMNASIKASIFENFSSLQQDQTPKYNKMHAVLSKSPTAFIYNHLMYCVLAIICIYALTLFFQNKTNIAHT